MATDIVFGANPYEGDKGPTVFKPQPAEVVEPAPRDPTPELVGLPEETIEEILEHVPAPATAFEEPLISHGTGGVRDMSVLCRLMYYVAANNDRRQTIVKVPRNRLGLFIEAFDKSPNAYHCMESLTLEVPHNCKDSFFMNLANILLLVSGTLQELKIFGVGADSYGNQTSSLSHRCGKVDTSTQLDVLPLAGQEYRRRIRLINSLRALTKLKVLVLDNLNMPVTQAQIFKNKPRLERLRIGTDPRSKLHDRYMLPKQDLDMCNMIYPIDEAPPLKELDISLNGVTTSWKVIGPALPTLEILNLTVPPFSTADRYEYLRVGAGLFGGISAAAKLRTLRLCIHDAMDGYDHDAADFMWNFRSHLANLPSLKVVEVHINWDERWFAQEFITELPDQVERLFFSDQFVQGGIKQVIKHVGTASKTSTMNDTGSWVFIGEDLSREDFIPFSNKKLAFVGYEYNDIGGADFQQDILDFMTLNGRMLDKERNRHLAELNGQHIPIRQAKNDAKLPAMASIPDMTDMHPPSWAQVEFYREKLAECLDDNHPYFGNEDEAERVFLEEPVAEASLRLSYSLPTICDIENPFGAKDHWLS